MIDVSVARRLLDFGRRLGDGPLAEEQLQGAVAIHNLLCRQGVAYLADEVGMGKTYVALGAVALFRHFQPQFRVLVIAPRRNIQVKWIKELGNFVAHNVRFPDLRVKGVDYLPARPPVLCENAIALVREASVNPDRDFFCRLSSFSLTGSATHEGASAEGIRLRDELRRHFPWLSREIFDLRDKQRFKDSAARAICCALPVFDLVIVDEAHNLKRGFAADVAARNRVLALAFGHPEGSGEGRLFRGYAPRARRVLFLSATPVEDSYEQLWNQLHVFGLGAPFEDLRNPEASDARKRQLVGRFLIRRVTEIRAGERALTRNLYRREWRHGGVAAHDEPLPIGDPRERLVVALVQKKVMELLQSERFGNSFQIGMLASFESFLETAQLKKAPDEPGNFDGVEQTADLLEREGIDVSDVNRLARSYRERFGEELPHPKMDAIVSRLADAWQSGRKSLVFVRRVASVTELKRKLDERYNRWVIDRLRAELPGNLLHRLGQAETRFQRERKTALARGVDWLPTTSGVAESDDGGADTFFAWFLRGRTPMPILSGSRVRLRYAMPQSPFFEDNYVASILGCEPGEVRMRLATVAGMEREATAAEVRCRSCAFLRPRGKPARGDRFEAVQAAAVDWLRKLPGAHQERAELIWRERFEALRRPEPTREAPEIGDWLECRTFFTELRRRPELRQRLWPERTDADPGKAFREQELRARLLASSARLGHAFIDLYTLTIRRLGSLKLGAMVGHDESGSASGESGTVAAFLDLLEDQMRTPVDQRGWRAFDELAAIAAHFDLILDVNLPEARAMPLGEASRHFGVLLSRQQPVGGMANQINQTVVRQFRMPGYPSVLVTTDLLQEGEDLHTFCSSVLHYGISWTPSAMEQRVGRVDRARSATHRRLGDLGREPTEEEKLQVYFPHLADTVERLQVRRVLSRMNEFLRLMHEGLILPGSEARRIDLAKELCADVHIPEPLLAPLRSAFRVTEEHLRGSSPEVADSTARVREALEKFQQLRKAPPPGIEVDWEKSPQPERLFGTARLGRRQQPFTLLLRSLADRVVIRCVSPVGRVELDGQWMSVHERTADDSVRIGAIPNERDRSYDLTVEADVLLTGSAEADRSRVGWLVRHVVEAADRMEQVHLPGRDEPMESFRTDLEKEQRHDS